MTAPVYSLALASPDVVSLISKGGRLKLYLFGEAPQGVVAPYVVWQMVGGSPENRLAGIPDMDNYTIQIDVYAENATDARQIKNALRDAYEPHAYVVSYNFEAREPDTRLYRYSFTIEFMTPRDVVS